MLFQPETTSYYLLYCHNFSSACSALMNDPNLTDATISQLNKTAIANVLPYSDSKKTTSQYSKILQCTIKLYVKQNDLVNHSFKGFTYIYDLY